MRLSGLVLASAALAMTAVPAVAATAPVVSNPAMRLSLGSAQGIDRAATPSQHKSKLAGSALAILIVAAAAAVAGIAAAASGGNSSS